jgi:hypothetical protein
MNKKVLFLGVLITALIAYLMLKPGSEPLNSSLEKTTNIVTPKKEIEEPQLKPQTAEEIKKTIEKNKEEIAQIEKREDLPEYRKSLAKMARILAAPFKEDLDHQSFLELLKENNLEPIVRDRNDPDLGRIIHIRTKNSLPGTRYLQARFQNTPDGQTVASYITFDYRPGEKSVEQAHSEVSKWLGLKAKPKVQKEGYRLSDAPNCHIVWTKEMSCEDLKNHQFNAYDCKSDTGTIQVMYESDIHCGMNEQNKHDADHFHVVPEPDPVE